MIEYAKAQMEHGFDACEIPERMHDGLRNWILYGREPGGFLCAVFRNDLMDAIGRADDENKVKLWRYAQYLYNYAPAGAWGSEEAFETWAKQGGLHGTVAD